MADPQQIDDSAPTRRALLSGALVVGAVPLLAACGSDDEPSAGNGDTTESTTPTDDTSSSQQTKGGGEGVVVAAVADIPEGGGIILLDDELVVTQPSAGEFKGFTSICTHNQCPLDNVSDGTINCICHGSMFDIATGEVVGGPAPAPLAEKPIAVEGQDILLSE